MGTYIGGEAERDASVLGGGDNADTVRALTRVCSMGPILLVHAASVLVGGADLRALYFGVLVSWTGHICCPPPYNYR